MWPANEERVIRWRLRDGGAIRGRVAVIERIEGVVSDPREGGA